MGRHWTYLLEYNCLLEQTSTFCVNEIQASLYKVVASDYLQLETSHNNGRTPENETSHLY